MPSLARSVPKPLKVPSLARSVHKPLKVPSLARSVLKPGRDQKFQIYSRYVTFHFLGLKVRSYKV